MSSFQLPKFIHQYDAKIAEKARLQLETDELKNKVTAWIQGLPIKSMDLIDGKLTHRNSISKEFLETSLMQYLSTMSDSDPTRTALIGAKTASFIWSARGVYKSMKLQRSYRREMIMRGTNVVVVQPIPKGSELLISYGPEYTRDYCVSRYTLEKQQYKTLKD